MLDKTDVVPLYIQLQRFLKEEILKGTYPEGDMIPSETQLTKKYGITRTTVRKAISNLVNEGFLQQVHGKGTFVRFKRMKYSIWNFGGFTDYIKGRNETPVSKVLEAQTIFNSEGSPYFKLVRARGIKREQAEVFLTIDTSLLPLELFPGLDTYDFAKDSLYRVLRDIYKVFPRRSEIGVRPVMSGDQMQTYFQLSETVPLLMAEGKVFDDKGRDIEAVKVVYSPEIEFKIMTTMH
ncbi:GntR family transcriptional regulator [Brevibacillus sp. B_LB10_24]|uniref:GntR family transcriptional regulator n=1 Tax=Brevibacillus sp. B_LB10_24 TaxID=3380645 RepID=UPI0038B77817